MNRARAIVDRATLDAALSGRELWTPKLVRDALVDAYRMLRRIGGRIGPGHLKAFWPEYQVEPGDFVQQSLNRTLRPTRTTPIYRLKITVERMESVLLGADGLSAWLRIVPEAMELRETLRAFVRAELDGMPARELCRRRGWVYTTALTHRDRAAGIIAQRLNAAKVEVWT